MQIMEANRLGRRDNIGLGRGCGDDEKQVLVQCKKSIIEKMGNVHAWLGVHSLEQYIK